MAASNRSWAPGSSLGKTMSQSPYHVSSLDDEYKNLCVVVGHLFLTFGRLEGVLSAVLRVHLSNRLSPTSEGSYDIGIPAAVYGSMRYSNLKDTVNRITSYEEMPAVQKSFLGSIFKQCGDIQALRDVIAHQQMMGFDKSTDAWEWAGLTTTRDPKNTPIYQITANSISHAAWDLGIASDRIGVLQTEPKLLQPNLNIEPISWRYKPSMLSLQLHDAVSSSQARKPPPRS